MSQTFFTFHVISNLILLTFAAYFGLRFIWPLSVSLPIKIGIFFVIFLLTIHATVFEILSIHVPDSILIVTSWCVNVIVIASILAFCADTISLLLRLFGMRPLNVYLLSTKYVPVILCATCILCTYGMYQALRVPPIRNVTLQFEQLPKDLEGIRIVHMADPHMGKFFRKTWLDTAVDNILAAQADIVCITGDAVDAPFTEIQNDVLPFARLQTPLGVYFVAGNHEYINNYTDWIGYFGSLPHMTVLENTHKNIPIGNSILSIIGLTDRAAEFGSHPLPNAQQALEGFTSEQAHTFRILLSHRPGEKENAAVQADLQLSGHTHGGILWFLQGLIAKSNGGYVSGLYDNPVNPHDKILVSNGMGVWDGFPMRLGVNSEIIIITLTKSHKP